DEDLDDATRAGFLRTMREQVERLTKLTTDLLDLSRVDAGGLSVERVPTDLAEAARLLVGELHGLAEQTGHELEGDVEGEAWALGDEERIAQVGRALIVNAFTHTPAGTSVWARARSADGRVWLDIEDDGPGIPADQL